MSRPKPGDRVAVIDAGGDIHRAEVKPYPTGLFGPDNHVMVRFDSDGHRSAWALAYVTTDPEEAERIAGKQRAFMAADRGQAGEER